MRAADPLNRMRARMAFSLKGKKVLVTGGTGSIGSEIVRQVLAANPAVVRVFSRDETKQHELAQSLSAGTRARFLIGDVRDPERVRRAFSDIDVVFHAAAMKHVAACEYNPFEAVQTNVLGTQNVIQAALDARVGRMVMISTDKAVNPTSTMGATKLVAERIVSAANQWAKGTVFSAVRFGNVLGSRGSVVPIIQNKIARNEEIQLNDPTMTRFVMTVGDAVKSVLKAMSQARGGEIFILKMPVVQVEDLIKVVAERAARRLKKDAGLIRIRPKQRGVGIGEKVQEELLTLEEALRADETKEFFVVQPAWKQAMGFVKKKISVEAYQSHQAKFLEELEIHQLLDRAGL